MTVLNFFKATKNIFYLLVSSKFEQRLKCQNIATINDENDGELRPLRNDNWDYSLYDPKKKSHDW